jgi:MFS transporter, ACS family, D-galactonate transporter
MAASAELDRPLPGFIFGAILCRLDRYQASRGFRAQKWTAMSFQAVADSAPPISARTGIWGRQLNRYPSNGPRALYLGIVFISTITLYYELYVQGSVVTTISSDLHMSLAYLITVSIVGFALGAFASVGAGLADRWGRANIVVYGLAITGGLVLFGLAGAHSKTQYLVWFAIVSMVEGTILVATPALVRDFSPQLGRASAMGFWMLGPVVGSLVVSLVSSTTLDSHPDWHFQFRVCGIVGLAVFAIAFGGLRELAPRLRDQLMISLRDRALIEARARGIDPEQALSGHWRQMLRFDITGPALAISLFLLFYYIAVGLLVVFFATTFGYSLSKANSLGNWYWSFQAVALILTGLLSDRFQVRKPFMIIGALVSATGVALFAIATTDPTTTYAQFVWMILPIAVGGGIVVATWMAAFTETVEKRNPAATATGLAVMGAILRTVVVIALIGLIYAISAAGTLVDKGPSVTALLSGQDPSLTPAQNAVVKEVAADQTIAPRVQSLAVRYKAELDTAAKIKPATLAALTANPADPAVQAEAVSEISGKPVADVGRTFTLNLQYRDQLATAAVLTPATQAALLTNPDPATQAKAVGEIAAGLKVDQTTALGKLLALSQVPPADLVFLRTNGPAIQSAGDQLIALAEVPAANLAFVAKYGPSLQDPQVLAALNYLRTEGTAVWNAQREAPLQWQRWWWICFAGQIVFLPFTWLLTGRWSSRKAREDARAHDEAVRRELAALTSAAQTSSLPEAA